MLVDVVRDEDGWVWLLIGAFRILGYVRIVYFVILVLDILGIFIVSEGTLEVSEPADTEHC